MFGIGMTELIVIFIVVLIFFGPKRLPELAKALGRGIAEFRKAANEVRSTVETEIRLDDQSPKTVDKQLLSPTVQQEKAPAAATDTK